MYDRMKMQTLEGERSLSLRKRSHDRGAKKPDTTGRGHVCSIKRLIEPKHYLRTRCNNGRVIPRCMESIRDPIRFNPNENDDRRLLA